MPFPVIKLFSLFIKQLSKPLAGYIKRKAKEHHSIRTYLCIPPAQFHHRIDVKLRMWSAGAGRSKSLKIAPLSEAAAIDIGAEMLGELFIFTVGAGVIAMEYWRQTANAARKEKKQDDTMIQLRKDLNQLTLLVEARQETIDKLIKSLEHYQPSGCKIVKVEPKNESGKLKR
ncbi:optic atrophy 3 protein homolog [Watersipora subatra]|uniref:optic atrophy 3 protein homolog n=1 Tax=Watersipora subatra TaxID=2589382 RepID=UPI00355C786E